MFGKKMTSPFLMSLFNKYKTKRDVAIAGDPYDRKDANIATIKEKTKLFLCAK